MLAREVVCVGRSYSLASVRSPPDGRLAESKSLMENKAVQVEVCTGRILSEISENGRMDQGEIKRKIISKEYTLVRNSNKRLKSDVWETLYCIKDKDDSIIDNYVACTKCNLVLKQSKDGSTKNLLTHIGKCSGMKSSTKQTTIGNLLFIIDQTMAIKKIKSEHKQSITNSLSQMSVLDFKPFTTCIGVGFINYSQNLIDIAANIGIYILICRKVQS